MLEVRLIGEFDIRFKGEPIALATRASQSLFAYLILTAGTWHRREKLAGMYWPDASEKTARTYLRQELWRIRKALAARSTIDYLDANDISISFNHADSYRLDVAVLKMLSDRASADELMEGLSVYKGELLPGFYDTWVTEEREHLQSLYEKRMGQLLHLLETEERWQDMRDWGEKWISSSPASERACQHLMRAYRALGEHAQLVATYERCVTALQELGLEPSEQTCALRIGHSPRINIPIPLTSFVGRKDELEEVANLLKRSRLVTLTGSGGVGKTRLAIQLVADVLDLFPDGIWFLDLASLSDGAFIANTLAGLLGLQESGEKYPSITELLVNYFRTRSVLIIFDNCEHLIESCAGLVHTLLTSCEKLSILATSREILRVAGEISYRVPSLEIPTTKMMLATEDLSRMDAVKLFVERAKLASPGFAMRSETAAAVAQICMRLDGIPLAIELAAARTNMLTVEQLLKRLDDRFNLLTNGSRSTLQRHQTLRATIDWSYGLLSERECILFRRLAIFVSGATLEAVEKVCMGVEIETKEILDLLSQLINKSLVQTKHGAHASRYYMLETVRQFAAQKLIEADEEEKTNAQHLGYLRSLAARAKSHLRSPQQLVWLDLLESEYDNIRAALGWAKNSGAIAAGLSLLGDLEMFWIYRAHFLETITMLEGFLAYPLDEDRIEAAAKANLTAGWLKSFLGDYTGGHKHARESIKLYEQLGPSFLADYAEARNLLTATDLDLVSDPVRICRQYEENLQYFMEANDRWGIAHTFSNIGAELQKSGDLPGARQAFERSLELTRECGDQFRMAELKTSLAGNAFYQGNYKAAREQFEEVLAFYRQASVNFGQDVPLWMLGVIAVRAGDYYQAKDWYSQCLLFDQRIGWPNSQLAECLIGFAGIAIAERNFNRAAQLLGAALAVVQSKQRSMLEKFDQIELERLKSLVLQELGAERYDIYAVQGYSMELEELIEFALHE